MKSLPFALCLLSSLPLVAQDTGDAAAVLSRHQPVSAYPADPVLDVVRSDDALVLAVGGQAAPFCGVVVVAPSPQLAHSYVGLPPLLAFGDVLGYGKGDVRGFALELPLERFGLGMTWYAQGLAIDDHGLRASPVVVFTLAIGGL